MTDDAWTELRAWRTAIELRLRNLETDRAVEAERYSHINKRLDDIERSIGWVTKIIIGAVLAGFIGFMLKGGINVPL